jgi:riboflavin kinase / FMN adenylyltransferase
MSLPPVSPLSFTIVRGGVGPHAELRGSLEGGVLAIGNFEGVHRGHRAVIDTAIARAREQRRPAAALTFEPHPRSYFDPDSPVFRLSDVETKIRLLKASGLDGAIVLDFDAVLAGLNPAGFVERILVELFAVSGVVIGYDFHFGQGRGGSPDFLVAEGARRGFSVTVVPPFVEGGRRVSSGLVRAALKKGDVEDAADLLGYPWFVTGEVVHGDKRGRELGFPTANIRLDPACALRHGVYAVRVGHQGRVYDGVANFGRRPMFDTGAVLLEAFLFDFAGDLYGATLDVAFVGWIRPELAFESVAELVRRMGDDRRQAAAVLARTPPARFPPRLP